MFLQTSGLVTMIDKRHTPGKMKFGFNTFLYLLLLMLLPGVLFAQESRLALVIGNSEYAESPLRNPVNDATDMTAVLKDLGFKVILSTNADRREMGRAIREFGRELKSSGGVGLFYYAGHGIQIENRNYLIPVGTPLAEEDEVPYESVDVGSVLAKMESAGNSLNLIILDACRNNPFPKKFRSTNRGLARVEAPIGSLVVYATAPGAVAADGDGRNGVFTGELISQLRSDGLSLTQTIRRTRAAVVKATNGKQVPWESSSLLKDYYFTNKPEASPEKVASAETATAIAAPRVEPRIETQTEKAPIIEAAPERKAPEVKQPTGVSSLTIGTNPPDARVRIMNITDKYKPGMSLDRSRSYDVYITREGFEPYRDMVALKDAVTSLHITLKKKGITEPEMIPIAGGSFMMGCAESDRQCESYEKPARPVNIGPYYISATEITVGQFRDFISNTGYVTDADKNSDGNSGCFTWSDSGGISRSEAKWGWDKTKNWNNPGYKQTPDHPVTCVSWNDANSYVQWLAKRTGRAYALPSESEWELAARAGTEGKYGSANKPTGLCAIANVADNTQSPSGSKWASRINCTDYHWFSSPVASFPANGFGLFDMQGNAWEWVADTWTDNLSTTPGNGNPYIGTSSGNNDRVLRGGGWNSDATHARLSSRSKGQASGRASMTGFRVVIKGR